ncbi:hypothetical protein GW17_00045202 [Ensete ventricosum]|nr:hypothetical protein GW17_00045202 [Ensete ventricosum]
MLFNHSDLLLSLLFRCCSSPTTAILFLSYEGSPTTVASSGIADVVSLPLLVENAVVQPPSLSLPPCFTTIAAQPSTAHSLARQTPALPSTPPVPVEKAATQPLTLPPLQLPIMINYVVRTLSSCAQQRNCCI